MGLDSSSHAAILHFPVARTSLRTRRNAGMYFPVLLSAFAGKQPRGREPITLEPSGRFVNSPPLPSARSRAGVVGTLWACKRASRWLCGFEWWALVDCSGLCECFCAGVRVCERWCVLALGAWASACSRACCVTSTVRARVLNRTEPLCLKLGLASAGLVRNLFLFQRPLFAPRLSANKSHILNNTLHSNVRCDAYLHAAFSVLLRASSSHVA